MKSRARVLGHPIHPMLIAFPIAFYTATVVTLIVFVATGDSFWYRVAMWSNLGGVVMAVVAAVPGLIDLLGLPRHSRARSVALRHAGFNSLALVLFTISLVALYRSERATNYDATAPLVLGILGIASTVAAGWLGWNLTQTYHVGIEPYSVDETVTDEEVREHRPHLPVEAYPETHHITIRH